MPRHQVAPEKLSYLTFCKGSCWVWWMDLPVIHTSKFQGICLQKDSFSSNCLACLLIIFLQWALTMVWMGTKFGNQGRSSNSNPGLQQNWKSRKRRAQEQEEEEEEVCIPANHFVHCGLHLQETASLGGESDAHLQCPDANKWRRPCWEHLLGHGLCSQQ